MAGESRYFAVYLIEEVANPIPLQVLFSHEPIHGITRYVHASHKYAKETHRKYHHLAKPG